MSELSTEEVGFLIKEMIKLAAQEQSPSDAEYINKRIGEIFDSLAQYLGLRPGID